MGLGLVNDANMFAGRGSLYGGSFSHMILYYQGEKYRSLCLGLHTVYKGSEGLLNPGVESRFYCVGLEV